MFEIIIYIIIMMLVGWLTFLPITWDRKENKKRGKNEKK
jgi:hypothetical protein